MPRKRTFPALLSRSDMGNAEFFAAVFRDRLRFDHLRQRWLLYRGHWWSSDVDGELMRLAKQAVRFRLKNAVNVADDDKRQEEARWAMHSESLPRLEAMVKLARSERPIADDGSNWDSNPWLLGVSNGVVDLRTGNLRPSTPDDRITLHTDVSFDPNVQCPRWTRCITEVFDGDPYLISYIERAVGYSLTGETSEQCCFCCHGDGANGKSTFLNAIRHVLGTYAGNLPFSAFELTARSTISNDVATLPGKRVVTAIETDESARLNEARIKALTGGDIVTARPLYREYFDFKPVAKFWLAFNHRPVVSDDSHGFWRRIHNIPFLRRFDPHGDPALQETLRAEAPGILAWAVRGCLEWQKQGLNPPAAVQQATRAYRASSDPLREFLADRYILHSNARVTVAELWSTYCAWIADVGEVALQRKEFTRRLEARGLRKERHGHSRAWTWLGIRLKTDTEAQHPEFPADDADMRADADVHLQ